MINPLNANPEKWSNTLKQIVANLPTICLSVFDHFMNLAIKGLKELVKSKSKEKSRTGKISKEGFRKVFNVWTKSYFSNSEMG